MSRLSEQELEEIMRSGLQARADRLEAGVPDVGRLRRRPRRAVWLASAAAAAAVAVGVPVVVGTLNDNGHGNGLQVADVPAIPDAWRFESYGGVQVRVPPSWQPGYGPMPEDYADYEGSGVWCADYEAGKPYVGRPVYGSDICMGFEPDQQSPTADSVWFGAPVPVGTREVGDYTQVTRGVGSTTVTVTTHDPVLGAQILSTAEAIAVDANGCRTGIEGPPSPEGPAAVTEPSSLAACFYMVEQDLSTTLIWSGLVTDPTAVNGYVTALEQARANAGDEIAACKRAPDGEWISLGLSGSGGTRWDVVDFACQKVLSPAGDALLTRADVEPWSLDGVRAYVAGPVDGQQFQGLFRGFLG